MRIQAHDLQIGDLITRPTRVRVRHLQRGDGGELITNPGAPDEMKGHAWEWVDVERQRRVFLDTEFDPRDPTLTGLLSIGLTDNGSPAADFYAINADANLAALADHPFIVENVAPFLPVTVSRGADGSVTGIDWDKGHPDYTTHVRPAAQIAEEVAAYFPGERAPELLANWGKDDLGYLHRLFGNDWGAMPDGVPRIFTDLEVLRRQLDAPQPPAQAADEHHALADARFNRDFHTHLLRFQERQMASVNELAEALCGVDRRGPWQRQSELHRNGYRIAATVLLKRFEVRRRPQDGQ
ncbi:hypothetical protein ABT039_22530 [Streptomyces lasiicapitis]|uniref:hypothetical protein n=1 Tax=Streptomyces lasiicapitis TaxID=1923961 RepID=UPI003321BC28